MEFYSLFFAFFHFLVRDAEEAISRTKRVAVAVVAWVSSLASHLEVMCISWSEEEGAKASAPVSEWVGEWVSG